MIAPAAVPYPEVPLATSTCMRAPLGAGQVSAGLAYQSLPRWAGDKEAWRVKSSLLRKTRSSSCGIHVIQLYLWSTSCSSVSIVFCLCATRFHAIGEMLLSNTLPQGFLFESDYTEIKIKPLQRPYLNGVVFCAIQPKACLIFREIGLGYAMLL